MQHKNKAYNDNALISRIKKGERAGALETLFHRYQPFLHHFAYRYKSYAVDYEEAYQIAALGLMEAIDRFDLDRGVTFMTFAYPTVDGELKRHYRDYVEVIRIPRRLRDLKRKIMQEREGVVMENGSEPTIAELSHSLNVDKVEIMEALAAYKSLNTVSLNVSNTTEGFSQPLLSSIGDPDPFFDIKENGIVLDQILDNLPGRLRLILRYRLRGWTQRKIARELELSQIQISRLERKAKRKLRKLMDLQETMD